jgi:hypothetical protein
MSLSVCLFTRNEAHNIERVLRSVAAVADEMVVVDTGSTDGTIERATQLGARVCPYAWQDDFAAARNYALDQATGDWALWINADEELLPAGLDRLPAYLAQDDALAYGLRVQELLQADRPDHFTETMQPRLFRRDAGVRYVGRLHPRFAAPLDELAGQQGKKVVPTDLILRHHGYLSVQTPGHLRWAVRLLEAELRDRPGQLHYLIEYGRHLLWLNDPRGHEVLAEAAEQVLQARDAPAAPAPTVGSLLEYLLTVSPHQSRSRVSREEARELALRWFRQSPPVLWALAQHHFQAGDARGAAALLEELLQRGRTGEYDHIAGFNPDILGPLALLNLGACYARLGDPARAEYCFGQLLNDPAHGAKARENLAALQNQRPG